MAVVIMVELGVVLVIHVGCDVCMDGLLLHLYFGSASRRMRRAMTVASCSGRVARRVEF